MKMSEPRYQNLAVVAAVVGIERVAGILGTTAADTLRLAVLEALEHDADDAPGEVARVVLELVRTIGLALPRRSSAWPADATVLNPETGGHKIATDLSRLRAATASTRIYDKRFVFRTSDIQRQNIVPTKTAC